MKTTKLSANICQQQQAYAFDKAEKAFKGKRLGLLGVAENGDYHFQELGNPVAFVINKFGKAV